MAPPRKHPLGTTRAEMRRQSRARLGATSVEIDARTAAHLDAVAQPGETRKATVARLARVAAEGMA